jgi:hypothetical protein
MTPRSDTIEQDIATLRKLVARDPELAAEFHASEREFFRRPVDASETTERAEAGRRHFEWFLFERESTDPSMTSLERVLAKAEDAGVELSVEASTSLLDSFVSVFEVTGVERGQGLWISDIAGVGEYPVHEPDGSSMLTKGDLIVGRVFRLDSGLYYLSNAAAFFRNEVLLQAVRRDIERARADRRGVLRLTQAELEAMFFAGSVVSEEDAVGESRRLLLDGGVAAEDVESIFAELASTPPPEDPLLYHPDDPLGAVLDRLAFETSLDLDVVRRSLVAARVQMARQQEPSSTERESTGAEDGAAAPRPAAAELSEMLAEFDRRSRSGAPVVPLLDELEQRLSLHHVPDDSADEDTPAPDFPGVVGAMIEEFLWETGTEHGGHIRDELEIVQSFGQFAENIGVFENLSTKDLLTYTCYWLPESDRLENADAARRLLRALDRFCAWVEAQHELPLHSEFKATLHSLQSSLPRVMEANRRRTRGADRTQGELYEFTAVSDGGERQATLRDREGSEHSASIDPLLADWLRPGDRLRARRQTDGQLAVYCCYPPESRGLSEL